MAETVIIAGVTYQEIRFLDMDLSATSEVYALINCDVNTSEYPIACIKRLRGILGTGLKFSKDIYEALKADGSVMLRCRLNQAAMLRVMACGIYGEPESTKYLWQFRGIYKYVQPFSKVLPNTKSFDAISPAY